MNTEHKRVHSSTAFNSFPNKAKGSRLCLVPLLRMKRRFILRGPGIKSTCKSERTTHIYRKTESLWQEDDVLGLSGRKLSDLLSCVETINTKCYQALLITIYRVGMFAVRSFILQNLFATYWKHSIGKRLSTVPSSRLSDYHFLTSLRWPDKWFAAKGKDVYRCGITNHYTNRKNVQID